MPKTVQTPTSMTTAVLQVTNNIDAIDLFAGPGGWDIAADRLGLEVLGIEWDQAACDTRRAAGLHTVQGDVRDFGPGSTFFHEVMRLGVRGFIASPPCQTFSMAGSGSGRRALSDVLDAIRIVEEQGALAAEHGLDDRTSLVVEPLRWVLAALDRGTPFQWIALEQVPTVLPVWEAYADVLATHGYVCQVAILNAEQYGVPQTRRRAVLVARYEEQSALPTPTHSRYHSRDPQRLDDGVKPWVPMSQALGWGYTERPSHTVCAGGARTGGAEPFTKQPRTAMIKAMTSGEGWAMRSNYSGPPSATKRTAAERGRGLRPVEAPAFTITSRTFDFVGPDSAKVRPSVPEVAALQTFPADHPWQGTKGKQCEQVGNAVPPLMAQAILTALVSPETDGWVGDFTGRDLGIVEEAHGNRPRAAAHPSMTWTQVCGAGVTGEGHPCPVDQPTPAITTKGTAYLVNSAEAWRHPDWVFRRPATTVTSDSTGRIGRPGHKHRGPDCCAANREAGVRESQFTVQAVRLTTEQAALLQTFPADYPWQGTRADRYRQIGNAVPPLMAAAVFRELLS